MVVPFHPFRALIATAGAFRDDLAPPHELSDVEIESLCDKVDQLAATWAFAVAALFATPLALGYAAIHLGQHNLIGAIELPFFVCLSVATYNLARLDRFATSSRRASEARGRMASRLVQEFESHTTGWFWQTDSHGRITYISGKVAVELDTEDTPATGE